MKAALWILSGPRYIAEGRISALSVARHMPEVWRVLATPEEAAEGGGAWQEVIRLPARKHEQWLVDSTNYLGFALNHLPDQVVWFDSDVYCCMPFPELYDMTERFDLTGVHSPARRTARAAGPVPICFPEMVTGVNGMHNGPLLKDFVRFWLDLHLRNLDVYGNNDQASLREALWLQARDNTVLSCFQFYLMPPEWNLRLVTTGYFVRDKVRFLHGRPGGMPLHESKAEMERLAEQVNSQDGMRVWIPV